MEIGYVTWSSTRSGERPFPIGVDDHLRIAQVGNRIERCPHERINAGDDRKKREDKHEEAIPHACCDDALDHFALLVAVILSGAKDLTLAPVSHRV